MVIARLVTGIALLATLAACGEDGTNPGVTGKAGDSTDRTYVVTGVTVKGEPKDLVKDTEIRLRFEDGRLTVTAGCNTMSGAFTLEGTRLTVEPMSMTEMGCDRPRMDQDTWLAGLFEKPVQFTDGGDGAVISGDTVLTIADRETVSPDKPLAGTHWILDGIIDGDAASSVPQGSDAWLQIKGHAMAFDAGCTEGSGSVQVDGPALRFSDVAFEAKPCPAGDVVLPAFHAVIDDTATYSITENTLTLTNGDHGLTFRAR